MKGGKFDIYVYADWVGLNGPIQVGVLSDYSGSQRPICHFGSKGVKARR